jgi:hypothetical protein
MGKKEPFKHFDSFDEILPICSYCKCIRDDKWKWHEFDVFMLDNYGESKINLGFTHSICEKCQKEYFPEYII